VETVEMMKKTSYIYIILETPLGFLLRGLILYVHLYRHWPCDINHTQGHVYASPSWTIQTMSYLEVEIIENQISPENQAPHLLSLALSSEISCKFPMLGPPVGHTSHTDTSTLRPRRISPFRRRAWRLSCHRQWRPHYHLPPWPRTRSFSWIIIPPGPSGETLVFYEVLQGFPWFSMVFPFINGL